MEAKVPKEVDADTKVEFHIDSVLLPFLERTPFFAELSRRVRKVATYDIPTAGVAFDKERDDLVMYYNPRFMAGLTKAQVYGLLTHEFYHIILQHITSRRREPHKMWNVAGDLAINSMIIDEQSRVGEGVLDLPRGGLIPGRWPMKPDGREFSDDEKKGMELAALIATMPLMKESEWYFDELNKAAQEARKNCPQHGNGGAKQKSNDAGSGGAGDPGDDEGDSEGGGAHGDGDKKCTCGAGDGDGLGGFDDHSGWDQLSEEERQYVESRVKDMVGKAVKVANQRANGWGTIPAGMRAAIIASVESKVDWRNVLRQFVGTINRASKTSTVKRINRRYPYIHPGTKKARVPKLLIAIDMSGSVGDDALELFFGELGALTKNVSISVAPFDTAVDEKEVFEWRKGAKVQAMRVRCGGTDFNAPTNYANDPKNRGRWDGVLIMTDGMAPSPVPSRIKRAWVLAPGTKLEFESSETQIRLEAAPDKAAKAA